MKRPKRVRYEVSFELSPGVSVNDGRDYVIEVVRSHWFTVKLFDRDTVRVRNVKGAYRKPASAGAKAG
jgi:hypothetical protein